MTAGDEGDEHQMERRLQREANAYKGQCNEQRGPKATLPELASMKKLQIVLRQIWSALHGREDSSETLGEGLGAKGRRRWSKATPTGTCSLLFNPPRGEAKSSSRRSSWRQGPKDWGPTKPTKVQEQHPSSRRAITGPQGAKSESLSMGLGL